MPRIRKRFTYANVISTFCLILLVGGGTAYAATQVLPKDSVGAAQLKKHAVTPSKLSRAAKDALVGSAGARGAAGPAGPQGNKGDAGPTGPSDVYATFHEGGIPVTAIAEFGEETVLSLGGLPAGSYLIQATLQGEDIFESTFLSCDLTAGEDSGGELLAVGTGVGHMEEAPMSLQLTHRFASTGSVELECGVSSGSHMEVREMAITATKVGALHE
jgi:hypothetical protein